MLYVVADNGFAISVPASEQAPAPISELVRGFAGLHVWSIDGTDYLTVRETAKEVVSKVRAGVGPALIHARVTRPYSHSAADTQSKYRLPQELEWETLHDPIDNLERTLVDSGSSADEAQETRRGQAHRGRRGQEGARRRPPRPLDRPRPRRRPARHPRPGRGPAGEGGRRAGGHGRGDPPDPARGHGGRRAGAGVRRGRRRRPRGDPRRRRGQGRRVRHDPRPAAQLRPGPLLQHAARRGQHHRAGRRPGHPGPAPRARDPVLRLHLARHAADPQRGGHDPVAVERGVHLPDRHPGADRRLPPGRAIWHSQSGESIFTHVPGLLVAPVPGQRRRGAAAGGVPLRGPGAVPRAQAPAAPALHADPFPPADHIPSAGAATSPAVPT